MYLIVHVLFTEKEKCSSECSKSSHTVIDCIPSRVDGLAFDSPSHFTVSMEIRNYMYMCWLGGKLAS